MGDDPSIGEYERLLLSTKTTARKDLILLHPERTVIPGSTREWLKVGSFYLIMMIAHIPASRFDHGYIPTSMWNSLCVMRSLWPGISLNRFSFLPFQGIVVPKQAPVLLDPAAMVALKKLKNQVQTRIEKYRGSASAPSPQRASHASDFARLARRLCGKSIGVVLGGGGARGISHLV